MTTLFHQNIYVEKTTNSGCKMLNEQVAVLKGIWYLVILCSESLVRGFWYHVQLM